MPIRNNSPEHWIIKKLRGHEKDIEALQEERESEGSNTTLIRRVSETCVSDDSVTVTVDDSPGLVYDSGDEWDFSEFDT